MHGENETDSLVSEKLHTTNAEYGVFTRFWWGFGALTLRIQKVSVNARGILFSWVHHDPT